MQLSATYLNRESQKILVEVFGATSQNVQSSFVSTFLQPIDGKLHPATIKTSEQAIQSRQFFYLLVSGQRNTAFNVVI